MLFSGVMLFDLFIQILDNRFIYGRDLLLSYVTVGVLFGLSLVCNYAAIKKTHPYGKIVSNKSILIRVFIAIISFIGGTISDKTYIEAFCFTIGIMVFLYLYLNLYLNLYWFSLYYCFGLFILEKTPILHKIII